MAMTYESCTPYTGEAIMTATTAGDTRHLIQRFLDAHARGDAEAISKLLSEDVQWRLPRSAGVGPFRGVEEVSRALAGMAAGNWLDVSTISRDVRNIVIDGEYCWVYTCRDGLISEIHNYTDTLYAFRLFGLANGA